jgi:glycosyltransferase involved in cell wall biosynthesis
MGQSLQSRLSVCIICHNEERNIKRCLESLHAWVHEIVVVDSMSTDRTVDIAKGYTDRVFQRPWPGYAAQKNFALSKTETDWVLSLDADEMVSRALRDEISAEIAKSDALDGYRIPRRSFYQGRWINHSGYYPDRQLRLFRREKGCWGGGRVHERMAVEGRVGDLKQDLFHYPYGGRISGQLGTVNSFSTLLAKDMYDRGKRFHLMHLFSRPFFKFLEVYVLKRGFMDGLPGLIIAVSDAYAMFVRYVKLREIEAGL